jgi:hypothetical protein
LLSNGSIPQGLSRLIRCVSDMPDERDAAVEDWHKLRDQEVFVPVHWRV